MDELHGNEKWHLLTLLAEKSANNDREPAGNIFCKTKREWSAQVEKEGCSLVVDDAEN